MKTITLIAALAVASLTSPAFAKAETRAVVVADLDLASQEGQQTLDARLKSAARVSCGEPGSRSLTALTAHRRCKAEALAAARPQADRIIAAAMASKQVQLAAVPMLGKQN